MKILGIDPGLKATGYGFIEYHKPNFRLIETGAIQPKQTEPIQLRILKIYSGLNGLIDQHKPDVLVLEKLYTHYNHPTTASILGHIRGVVCLLCAQKDIILIEQSVKRIRKAITGNGSSNKDQIQRFVAQTFNIDAGKLTLDASDALALAMGYAYLNKAIDIDHYPQNKRLLFK